MVTSKKSPTRKVTNKSVTFKNGKNAQAEALMRQSFEPLFSPKDNKARLTFCGVEHSVIEWQKNGKQHEKPVMKLVFSCFDVTHEAPANIAVTCEYRLSERNRLGQILSIMGFELKKESVTVDEDDEFGIQQKQTNVSEIFDFLRGKCGLVYKANLSVAKRKNSEGKYVDRPGLWDIDYKSLESKLLKSGEQDRDMLASDISDEEFQSPEISMASEAD